MNWSQITTQEELLNWKPFQAEQGGYRFKLTGFEEKGHCWWCGLERLNRPHQHFCTSKELKTKEGHGSLYCKHFYWPEARLWCARKQKGKCANCGKQMGIDTLRIHHIIPLNGSERLWTPYNLPWNLVGFCVECHLEVHAGMKIKITPDYFLKQGALI